MNELIIIFVVLLLMIAVVTHDSFVFVVLYLFGASVLLGRWWVSRAIRRLTFKRSFPKRVFLGETFDLKLELQNSGPLPLVWLRLQDSLPIEISTLPFFEQVLSLGPREKKSLSYPLIARKRGYYPIGPLQLSSGDLLGLSKENRVQGAIDHITVYPKVIPLSSLGLPSHSPIGAMRHKQPIYEDPNRPVGKREYQTGDSLRRIDWKSSASVGRLQVKLFEPSVELNTVIFLNLNPQEYHYRSRFDAAELAIVAAASIANWAVGRKQSVGLVTNGIDPLSANQQPQALLPRKGRGNLIRMLETLARLKSEETRPLTQLLQEQRASLNWGTTLVVITGQPDAPLFDEFLRAQRAGLDVVLILCGSVTGLQEIRHKARQFGIPVYSLQSEQDMQMWRK